jgi:hypothetical protein
MANFAQLDENNIVIQVISIDDKDILNPEGIIMEEIGISFCKSLFGENTIWKQTSINGDIRFRYASIGYKYDEDLDAFIEPKPYPSWILNEQTASWESPLGPKVEIDRNNIEQYPKDSFFVWDEDLYQSDNTKGWVNLSTETSPGFLGYYPNPE